jgi:hypothetical protein
MLVVSKTRQTLNGFDEAAFNQHSDGISVTWIDDTIGDRDREIREALNAVRNTREVRGSSVLAIATVDDIESFCASQGVLAEVVCDPIEGNEQHALIKGIDPNNYALRQALTRMFDVSRLASSYLA